MISDVISREISREIDVRESIKTPNPNTHSSLCSIQNIYFAKMKCLHGEPCAQSTTEKKPSGSAIKTLAVSSFAQETKATFTKKPSALGNLQNKHNLAAKNKINSRKFASSKTC